MYLSIDIKVSGGSKSREDAVDLLFLIARKADENDLEVEATAEGAWVTMRVKSPAVAQR